MFRKLIYFIPIIAVFYACHQYDKSLYRDIPLHSISVGMSEDDIIENLGKPYNVIGSRKYKEGNIEVWEYRRYELGTAFDQLLEKYWLYFWNGKLEQWGRPGDWEKEADRIWEIRVR